MRTFSIKIQKRLQKSVLSDEICKGRVFKFSLSLGTILWKKGKLKNENAGFDKMKKKCPDV